MIGYKVQRSQRSRQEEKLLRPRAKEDRRTNPLNRRKLSITGIQNWEIDVLKNVSGNKKPEPYSERP